MRRFLRDSIITQDQTDFVDSFSGEITVPRTLPRWLWEGKALQRRHPTIKLAVRACWPPCSSRCVVACASPDVPCDLTGGGRLTRVRRDGEAFLSQYATSGDAAKQDDDLRQQERENLKRKVNGAAPTTDSCCRAPVHAG